VFEESAESLDSVAGGDIAAFWSGVMCMSYFNDFAGNAVCQVQLGERDIGGALDGVGGVDHFVAGDGPDEAIEQLVDSSFGIHGR